MMRSYDLDYVFNDEDPVEKSSPYSTVSAPIYRGRENLSGAKNNNTAMVGSGLVPSGPGSTRLKNVQDPQPRNTPGRRVADADKETRMPARTGGAAIGRTGSVPSEPGSLRLNTPIAPRPDGLPDRRIVELDFNRSIDEIVANYPRAERDSNSENHAEHWMRLMKYRQNQVENTCMYSRVIGRELVGLIILWGLKPSKISLIQGRGAE